MPADLVFDLADPSPRFEFSDGDFGGGGGTPGGKFGGGKKSKKKKFLGRGFRKTGASNKDGHRASSSSSSTSSLNYSATSSPGGAGGGASRNGSPDSKKSAGTASTAASTHDGNSSGNPDALNLFGDTFAMADDFDWSRHGGGGGGMTYISASTANSSSLYDHSAASSSLFGVGIDDELDGPAAASSRKHAFPSDAAQSKPANRGLPLQQHRRTPSYVSDVSEFSFDRVTVDTNDNSLGLGSEAASSIASWNLFEGHAGKGGVGAEEGDGGAFVPYTGDQMVPRGVAIAGRARSPGNNAASTSTPTTQHRQKERESLFLRLEQDGHNGNGNGNGNGNASVPVAGVISSDMSAVSEISGDNTASNANGSSIGGSAHDDDLALIRDPVLRDQLMGHNTAATAASANSYYSNTGAGGNSPPPSPLRRRSSAKAKELLPSSSPPSSSTSKVNSNSHSNSKSLLQDIQDSYMAFKRNRLNPATRPSSSESATASTTKSKSGSGRRHSKHMRGQYSDDIDFEGGDNENDKDGDTNTKSNAKNGILSSFLDNVNFCGWYFCGIDPGKVCNNDTDNDKDKDNDKHNKKNNNTGNGFSSAIKSNQKDHGNRNHRHHQSNKEDRKRQAEHTFVGRVITCQVLQPCMDVTSAMACGGGNGTVAM